MDVAVCYPYRLSRLRALVTGNRCYLDGQTQSGSARPRGSSTAEQQLARRADSVLASTSWRANMRERHPDHG